MPILVLSLFRFVRLLLSGHVAVAMENAALRVQLVAFQRKRKRPTLTSFDRYSGWGCRCCERLARSPGLRPRRRGRLLAARTWVVANFEQGSISRCATMDWLGERQERIEKKLAARHLREGGLVLYDVSSSFYEGRTCPLAQLGHDRDGKKGLPIIVYGVMTNGEGCPVAVSVYPGNTGDPTTVADPIEKLRERFGLSHVVLVGDRGMLTQPPD